MHLVKNNGSLKAGFTLVEVLIVLLIIGTLTALAVPQYQRIMERIRIREAVRALHTIGKGIEMYHLTNGSVPGGYSGDLSMLDVEVKPSAYWEYSYICFAEFENSCGVLARPQKRHRADLKYHEMLLMVLRGVANPYVEVMETQDTPETEQEEGEEPADEERTPTTAPAGPDTCKRIGGTINAEMECMIR